MWDVILQILSILGIILLVLLLLVLTVALLVLFFPINYRFDASRDSELKATAKARWLFGLLRVSYVYPHPGSIIVKLLWMTLYDSKNPKQKAKTKSSSDDKGGKRKKKKDDALKHGADVAQRGLERGDEAALAPTCETGREENSTVFNGEGTNAEKESTAEQNAPEIGQLYEENVQGKGFWGKILEKIEKIKYTIWGIYDKIKKIWENITYYTELLREENTKKLFHHVCLRLGRILKSIRPRYIRADVVFGTGAPDTTGYVYGMYGMLTSFLGSKVLVTPDFEQAVLKGELSLRGHITVWVLLVNALKLLFDRKLHLFIEKMKAGMETKDKSDKQA